MEKYKKDQRKTEYKKKIIIWNIVENAWEEKSRVCRIEGSEISLLENPKGQIDGKL